MSIPFHVLLVLLAAAHLYFLYFEMFAWETAGRRLFPRFPDELFAATRPMAANQGLYNGFLAAGLIWALFIEDPAWQLHVALFFFGCIAVAGIYGALTVSRKIFYVQALPALVGIGVVLLSYG